MDKTIERLTLVVSEQGFAFARVRPRAAREPGARIINVTYVIDEGPRIYIERINIIGNLRTRDYVIRREFRLAEGDAYNPLMVDKAKKRLQALGFFKTVDIKRRPGSAPDRVVLDVELVEQSTGELSFGAGYSTSEGVIGDVSHHRAQPAGQAASSCACGWPARTERMQIDLSFTEPRFLDRNWRPASTCSTRTSTCRRRPAVPHRTTGGSLRLGFPLAENLWLTNSYTLSHNEIYDVDTPTASRAIKEAAGRVIDVGLGHQPRLRHAQPSQEPDQRLLLAGRRRVRRPRRRRAVRPRAAARRASTTRSPRRSPSSAARSAATSRAGAARTCA